MKPVIALVGRPNVGKSTLFNQLTRTRDALVADFPGLTRDRKYGDGKVGDRDYLVIDTGGIGGEQESIDRLMEGQTKLAIEEADLILLIVDGRDGLTAADELLARELRAYNKPLVMAINKTDGMDPDQASADFYRLGIAQTFAIAAAHGRGIKAMMQVLCNLLPLQPAISIEERLEQGIRIAFIGRPNVGKSTLINRLLGEERLVTFDMPGTTRDSISVPFQRNGQNYTLIDTAGVRRRSRVSQAIEKFSIVKTLQAIESCDVVILVLDAQQGIAEQDATLLGMILESGRALVIAVNKWDGLRDDDRTRIRRELDLRLSFINFAEQHMISALHGTGVGHLMNAVKRAYRSAMLKAPTPELSRLLEQAVADHQPPLVHGRRIKLRYAHQGGNNPFRIIIHGNQTERLPLSYKRYLMNYYQKALKLTGAPVRIELKTADNPYAGKRNPLTPRQEHKRQRLMKHIKKRR